MNSIAIQQSDIYRVIQSRQGREMVGNALASGYLGGDVIRSLVLITSVPSMEFPNILKTSMVTLIRFLVDIHTADAGILNASQARISQLEQQLAMARQAAARPRVEQLGSEKGDLAKAAANAAPIQEEAKCADKPVGMVDAEVQSCKEGIKKEETCLYYRRGICWYGPTGTNQKGSCQFQHPMPCCKYDLFASMGRYGCKKKNKCKFMHRKLCKNYLKTGHCTKEQDGCGFFHPKAIRGKKERQEGKGPKPKKPKESLDSLILKILVQGLSRVEGKDGINNIHAPIT